MRIKFINPGFDYMVKMIMEFQSEEAAEFWSEPLFYFLSTDR